MHKLTPQPLEFLAIAPVRIRYETVIRVTPEEAFSVLADNERWPEWFPLFKECHTTSDGQGVDCTRYVDAGSMQVSERFIVWEPAKAWYFTIVESSTAIFRSHVEGCRLEPVGAGHTRVIWDVAAELAWYTWPIRPVLRWYTARMSKKLIEGLEQQAINIRIQGSDNG